MNVKQTNLVNKTLLEVDTDLAFITNCDCLEDVINGLFVLSDRVTKLEKELYNELKNPS